MIVCEKFRFFYKTQNEKAIILVIIGLVFFVINWIAFFICWAAFCFLATQQQSYSVDFNDATGNVEVKKVGTLLGSVAEHKLVPYASAVSAALIDSGSVVGGQPGKIVVLTLSDGTSVHISAAEPQTLAETRVALVNQHLADAKNGVPAQQQQASAPVVQQQPQPQYAQPVQPQYVDPQQQQQYVDPQQQQQQPYTPQV